ncbi:hypothetical protein BT69DRAFT_24820 [Atractiella rhizophila]|nr:hypothetical protein BT69DRAFT_24820 [Atractiella rhizophila]
MTLNAGSFEPHALLEANKLLPVHDSGDSDIVNAFRRVKNTLGQLFQLPDMPDAVTRAIGTSLKNDFFPRGPATQGRIATAAELRHMRLPLPMMPVAREISRRRYGSNQVSDFTANRKWSIHLYPYTAEIPATSESPTSPMRQYKYQPRSDFRGKIVGGCCCKVQPSKCTSLTKLPLWVSKGCNMQGCLRCEFHFL